MMPAERYADLARLAAEVARSVGDAIDVQQVAIQTRKRGRANFATVADHAAQDEIVRRLRAHDPGIPVLAEEGAERSLRKLERLWVVDPIDGTLNFSRAIPFYCVSIAYVEDGKARAGAVHSPRTGETFIAYEGGGATLNGLAIRASSVRRLSAAFVVTTPSRVAALRKYSARLRMLGAAALEVGYTAAARFDLFVHPALNAWDIAAGGLIAREAGAAMISLRTGEDARWDEGRVAIGPRALIEDAFRSLPELMSPERERALRKT